MCVLSCALLVTLRHPRYPLASPSPDNVLMLPDAQWALCRLFTISLYLQFVWPHRLPADFSFPETQDHHFGLICAERSHGKVGCSWFYMGHELQTLGWRSHAWPSARCWLPPHLVLSYVCKIQYFALHRLLDLDEGCAWHANKLITVASHQNL